MISVTLYTKELCGLCDEVKADLASLHTLYPHALSEVDIHSEPALRQAYRYSIPVVVIGEKTLYAPISHSQLADALQAVS